jgi:hypothetical protein
MLLVDAVNPMVILRLHVLFPARISSVQHQLLRTTITFTSSTVKLELREHEREALTWGLASRSRSLRSSGKSSPADSSAPPGLPSNGSLRGGLAGRLGATLSKYPRTWASARAASSGGKCVSLRAGRIVDMAACRLSSPWWLARSGLVSWWWSRWFRWAGEGRAAGRLVLRCCAVRLTKGLLRAVNAMVVY